MVNHFIFEQPNQKVTIRFIMPLVISEVWHPIAFPILQWP